MLGMRYTVLLGAMGLARAAAALSELAHAGEAGPAVRLCSAWCNGAADGSACMVDQSIIPCTGVWCKTTCERWVADVLRVGDTLVGCDAFAAGLAYPRGAEPCGKACLPPEVGLERYPMPTGFGFLCAPGTCEPAVQSRYASGGSARGLGVLRCPCNWFGADCTDDTRTVLAIKKRVSLGRYVLITLLVGEADWWQIVLGSRPGAVVRLQATANESWAGGDGTLQLPSTTSWAGPRPLEQPLALATLIPSAQGVPGGASLPVGELDVLTGPPDAGMSPVTTELLRRLRALPVGRLPLSGPGALGINPAVGGFFSRNGGLFMDALGRARWTGEAAASGGAALRSSLERFEAGAAGKRQGVTDVVLVATGTGLAAMRPTIELLIRRNRQALAAEADGSHASSGGGGGEGRRHTYEGDSGNGAAAAPRVRVHLYYGLRRLSHLPWHDEFAAWVERSELQLTLLLSEQDGPTETDGQCPTDQQPVPPVFLAAAERGNALARMAAELRRTSVADGDSSALGAAGGGPHTHLHRLLLEAGEGKLYVHQALAVDLSVESLLASAPAGSGLDSETGLSLGGRGARLDNMLVAVCGRSEILGGTERALVAACAARHARGAGMRGAGGDDGSHSSGGEGSGAPRVGEDGVGEDGAGGSADGECNGLVAQRLFLNI